VEYVATLEEVAERTPHAKVKRYAISNADSLKRRAPMPASMAYGRGRAARRFSESAFEIA
jgi:hypothetical protein